MPPLAKRGFRSYCTVVCGVGHSHAAQLKLRETSEKAHDGLTVVVRLCSTNNYMILLLLLFYITDRSYHFLLLRSELLYCAVLVELFETQPALRKSCSRLEWAV